MHAFLLTGVRNRIDSFIAWAWDYFGHSGGPQMLLRSDEPQIHWEDGDDEAPDAGAAEADDAEADAAEES